MEKPPSPNSSQQKARFRLTPTKSGNQLLKADSPVIHELTEVFGEDILDVSGDVSRKKLGAIVFADKAARARLNAILHPLIIKRSRALAKQIVTGRPGVPSSCLTPPLLIEAGAYDTVNLIVVVTASSETQLQRTLERSRAQGRTPH